MANRKICIFTGTRAEYGLLKPLMQRIREADDCDLQLLVSGSHLSEQFGYTVTEIEEDGFRVDEKVDIEPEADSATSVCRSTGLGVIEYGKALERLCPDMLVLLGDRYEALAAATTAMLHRVPIAHIHGGESSYGAIDESIRHAITKMSYLHFTSTQEYADRVIQLGEHPNRVFHVGALGVENILTQPLLSRQAICRDLGIATDRQYLLVTFHPATLDSTPAVDQVRELLGALERFPEYAIIFTGANADAGGQEINRLLKDFAEASPEDRHLFDSLGMVRYLSAVKYAECVVGNSSSGIIEVPSLGIPTVDIGNRQLGRVRAASVLHCNPEQKSIADSVSQALSPEFKKNIESVSNPYQKPGTSTAIFDRLKTFKSEPQTHMKRFFDIGSNDE